MPKPSTSTARRREVRKTVPKRSATALALLRSKRVVWAVLYVMFLATGALTIIYWLGQDRQYYQGQVLDHPIVSRVSFEFENVEDTRVRRQQVESTQYNVYKANGAYAQQVHEMLDNLLKNRAELTDLPASARKKLDAYVEAIADQPTAQWDQDATAFVRGLFRLVIILQDKFEKETQLSALQRITVIHYDDPLPGQATEHDSTPQEFFSVDDLLQLEPKVRQVARVFKDDALEGVVVKMVMDKPQATYLLNRLLTEQRKAERVAEVEPVIGPHSAGEVLVAAGVTLDKDNLDLIRREREAYRAALPLPALMLRTAGEFGGLLLIAVGLWAYVFAYQPRIMRNPMRGLALTALLLASVLFSVLLVQLHPQFSSALVTFPALIVAIVLAIVYGQRFALAVGTFTCGLVTFSVGGDAFTAVVIMTGVGSAVAMLKAVRTRSKLVRVGMWTGLAMGAATLVVSLASRPLDHEGAVVGILLDSFYTVLSGLGAGLLVQGVLPAIERIFKVTTAMTLRELNDASHPLLQRLAQEAPGTYQHSLRIADMAEAAAETIGADGLLCRVGAMYHDIGKINKPQYFIENQGGGPNRHSKLSPAMSLLIIVGHVKDGVEMAREYGLPPELRHFIESHHGTTLVEYFYHAARRQKGPEEQQYPSEFEFRYPGPKPQTKEAAIMLLADSVEAAARSIAEPTPVRIEQLIDRMASKRLMDGQFDECNLTLGELHQIQQSLTKTLCAIHHSRIKYPGAEVKVELSEPEPDQTRPQTQSA